ncbi:MAG: hypothetical protein ABIR81_04885, partial [Ginsengibacter sp.]
MKNNIFFIIVFLFASQLCVGQKKEISYYADMPVLSYSTDMLKTGDTLQIDSWIKSTAASELKHTDSILENYTIKDIGIHVELIRTKALCQFITADWKALQHT